MADAPELRVSSEPLNLVKPAVSSFSPSIETAMARKSERGSSAVGAAVLLRSPNGTFWRVSVTDAGALSISAMVRS